MAIDDVPRGWYPDPDDNGASQRYWDGNNWTEQTRSINRPRPTPQSAPQPARAPLPPGPVQSQQAPQQRKSFPTRHKVFSTFVALIGLIVIIAAASSGGGSSSSSSSGSSSGSTATSGTGGANQSSIDHLSDYKITKCGVDATTNDFSASVAITNTSSKPSNYLGTLAWKARTAKPSTTPVLWWPTTWPPVRPPPSTGSRSRPGRPAPSARSSTPLVWLPTHDRHPIGAWPNRARHVAGTSQGVRGPLGTLVLFNFAATRSGITL